MFENLPKWNLSAPTLGGRQFWGDVVFFRGYRIQHYVGTERYRLISPDDFRLASGTEEECREQLEKEKDKNLLPRMTGRAVILIHGIIRSSKSFSVMKKRLEDSGAIVVGFDYPSTRVSLQECATYFKRVLESLDGIEQIDLVVHSMGGLLVRTYLQMEGEKRDPRLHRMVMLGVPNLGADMATKLREYWAFQWTLGPAGQQLVREGGSFIAGLPTPDFEFAIIAGCRGTEDGWNMLIPGDDDGTVSVDSTRLPGAADFVAIRVLHSTMMWNLEVIESSIRFLETGSLREGEDRQPIPLSESAPVQSEEKPPVEVKPIPPDSQ
ncbi:lipase family alpha/beta hydrolase [Planctomicrobium sp. SH527]|uniref:lipase family alpha/beta hydrolase n=1 Tax=Planctomicrobium sp. SH527 TaxID=3448123 RepID=UPI003F5C869F